MGKTSGHPEAQKPSDKPRTGKELVKALRKSGLIGIWRDRTDIGDSSEFARALREGTWRRKKSRKP